MRLVVPFPRLILLLAGLAVLACPGRAGSNLLDNSPFLPPNSLTGGATEAAPLELRSILKAGGSYQFSLFDTSNRQSVWVGLNEAGHDFVVKGFDAGNNAITVEQRGRTYKLTLKEAKIALLATVPTAAPGAAPGAPGGPNAAFPPPGAALGPRGPVPALTPEQLRNLEADINRRRELRRRAMAAPGTPAPAAPTPAGPPR
jgi:hypothetical protein